MGTFFARLLPGPSWRSPYPWPPRIAPTVRGGQLKPLGFHQLDQAIDVVGERVAHPADCEGGFQRLLDGLLSVQADRLIRDFLALGDRSQRRLVASSPAAFEQNPPFEDVLV